MSWDYPHGTTPEPLHISQAAMLGMEFEQLPDNRWRVRITEPLRYVTEPYPTREKAALVALQLREHIIA